MTMSVGDPVEFDFSQPMLPAHRARAVMILGLSVVEAAERSPTAMSSGAARYVVTTSDEPFKKE